MSLDPDTLYSVADSPRRRAIVRVVENRRHLSVDALAALSDVAEAGVASADHQQVATGLHHVHLPKLEDAGLVFWDREDGSIAATDRTATAAHALDVVDEVLGGGSE